MKDGQLRARTLSRGCSKSMDCVGWFARVRKLSHIDSIGQRAKGGKTECDERWGAHQSDWLTPIVDGQWPPSVA